MATLIVALSGTLTLSLAANLIQWRLMRYLAISPSFGILGQAAGRLLVALTFGPRIWTYGDVDKLNLVNDALSTAERSGMQRWNEIMTWVQSQIRADEKFLIFGGDEYGWGLRLDDTRYGRRAVDERQWRAAAETFCTRVQALLRTYPYEAHERLALERATGQPYVSITLAYAYSAGRADHRAALNAAELRVVRAKPKASQGQRGQILEAIV